MMAGAGGLLLALLCTAGGLYWAANHVPTFYEQALEQDPAQQRQANDELLASATALASTARKEGRWSALFTADQINGWLAVDLRENYPDLLPPEVKDPRVRLAPGKATIACRYQDGPLTAVISLAVEIYVTEPNVLALRIHNVRAGALPVPLGQVIEGVTTAAEEMQLQLKWAKSGKDPVALVTIPPTVGDGQSSYVLETIELREGAIYLAGHTAKGSPGGPNPMPFILQHAQLSMNVQP